MARWVTPPSIQPSPALTETLNGQTFLAGLLARRGFTDPSLALAFLDPRHYTPSPPDFLPGMDTACSRIETAVRRGERIWVWGDFDVDGQTSTAVLVSALRLLGGEVKFHIPVRATESHGVNLPHLQAILAEGADLLITCDTGITAHEALEYARKQGLDVIVTDHHLPGETLPPALAHLTPRLLPPGHPLEHLPGVGVAYKLIEALFQRARRPHLAGEWLDLVALGIVADVARQVGDTRYLLQRGLQSLRETQRPGLRAIFRLAELHPSLLNEEHIGFAIAPRLNALGRLGDANPAVELLTTPDEERALQLAEKLEWLNTERQLLTRQVVQAAIQQLERDAAHLSEPAIVLSNPEWPAGILGIAASALVERYHRPVILLTTPPGQLARGSARSVEGIDITACIATQASILHSFGGHPMAAGLSLKPESLPAFRRGFFRAVEQVIQQMGGVPEPALALEGDLRLDDLSLELVTQIERLAPFGPGNPPPVFAVRNLSIVETRPIGRDHEHLRLVVQDRSGRQQAVLWWNGANLPQPEDRFDLACLIRASNYRGEPEIQLEWVDFAPVSEESLTLTGAPVTLIDLRAEPHPRSLVEMLRTRDKAIIWAEGEARDRLGGLARYDLPPAETLIIWTAPPGRPELMKAIRQVQPRKVVLVGLPAETDDIEAFLNRLAGLVKFLLGQGNGRAPASLERLAGAAAQRESVVRLGLRWLAARGNILLEENDEGQLTVTRGPGEPQGDSEALLHPIKAILAETAAYRQFFRSAPLEALGIE